MTAKNKHGLTDMQEIFAHKVVELGDMSAAYRVAYPKSEHWKPATVWRKAHFLGKEHGKVRARIDELRGKVLRKHDVSVDKVIQEFARIAFMDIGEAFDADGNLKAMKEIPVEIRRAISGVDVQVSSVGSGDDEQVMEVATKKVRFLNKNNALENLAKHLGMYTKQVSVTGPDNGPIKHAQEMTEEQLDTVMAGIMEKL